MNQKGIMDCGFWIPKLQAEKPSHANVIPKTKVWITKREDLAFLILHL